MWRSFFVLFSCLLLFSCKKDNLLTSTNASIYIGIDTLHFDTVFTIAGSVTKSFRIKNENDQRIRISSIRLAGADSGVFRINVNGEPGPLIQSLDIAAGDSAHIFVNLRIPENTEALPFLVRDSISIQWNGQEKWIQLDAYGQNAHYIRNGSISSNTTWDNSMPYVILGPMVVEENVQLQITKGTKIYVHADAPIIVNGSLQIIGDTAAVDRVEFSGDRLDAPYSEFPASWPGIFFTSTSSSNQIQYANFKNAYQAIVVEGRETSGSYKLELGQVHITNAFDAGLLAINSSVLANNLLISNCGKNMQIAGGGKYAFNHSTLVAVSNNLISHKDPVVLISNAVMVNGVPVEASLQAEFRNCVIWGEGGTVENEVLALKEGSFPYEIRFESGIWKMNEPYQHMEAIDMLTNENPLFEQAEPGSIIFNFRLKEGSPALDKGISLDLAIDLDGKKRPNGLPDFGAYEKQ